MSQVTATEVVDQLSEQAQRLVDEDNPNVSMSEGVSVFQRAFVALFTNFMEKFEEIHGTERAHEFTAQFMREMENQRRTGI